MAATYEPIATTTLGSAAASITFSSIPATYTDLRVVLMAVMPNGNTARGRFNSDTSSNYSNTPIGANGSSVFSFRNTSMPYIPFMDIASSAGTNPQLITWDIFSYAGSTFKTSLSTTSNDNNGSGAVERSVALWRSTAAIDSITLLASTTFSSGTTATLYGILKST